MNSPHRIAYVQSLFTFTTVNVLYTVYYSRITLFFHVVNGLWRSWFFQRWYFLFEPEMNTTRLTINNPKLGDLEKVRQFVESELLAVSIHPDAIYDILLATTEAITNTILHGYQGNNGLIDVEVKQESNSVFVYLRDEAPQFDPTQVPTPDLTLSLQDRPMGGMGIHLMRQFMDRIIYRELPHGGNELILVKEKVIQK